MDSEFIYDNNHEKPTNMKRFYVMSSVASKHVVCCNHHDNNAIVIVYDLYLLFHGFSKEKGTKSCFVKHMFYKEIFSPASYS